jgi:hypothetical protein
MDELNEGSASLPVHTITDIRALGPCYDPVTGLNNRGERVNAGFLPEDWTGTALNILAVTAIPAEDRLWVVLRAGWIDDRRLRLFAVWCARQALALIANPDPRSVAACDVAERYANGQATDDELSAAWAAAWAAAWDAAWDAARAAARAAAWDAAGDAAKKWQLARLRMYLTGKYTWKIPEES